MSGSLRVKQQQQCDAVNDRDPVRIKMEGSDLRRVTVLPRAEWLRIQGSLNQRNIQNEKLKEAARQREEMHLRSKEVVKFWPHTFGGRTQKKLKAKKIREEIKKEEERKIDMEEARYKEDMRKEAIMKTNAQLFYQTEQGKEFHSALILTEVLKEREAQIHLKQRKLEALKDVEREAIIKMKQKAKDASKEEMEKAMQRKRECLAVADALKQQIKEHVMVRERERQQKQWEAEETERQRNLFLMDETIKKQKILEEKKQIIRDNMAHLSDRAIMRAVEGQQQEVEDKQRKMFVDVREKMMKLRIEKEAEMFRQVQIQRDRIVAALDTQRRKLEPNKVDQKETTSYPELCHEVGEGGCAVPQLDVFILRQRHTSEPGGAGRSQNTGKTEEHF